VIWTGSEQRTLADIAALTRPARDRLLVLGNAKSVEAVDVIGTALDGHAYYWSSGDPADPGLANKLAKMAQAVHARNGIWIAPAAPGFDARLVGGTRTVPRRDGQTLRESFLAASASGPDAIGIISWNEFSENTHIEPSRRYGSTELSMLAGLLGAKVELSVPVDSSEALPAAQSGLPGWSILLIAGAVATLPGVVAFVRRRSLRSAPHQAEST
jgi:hypothetical protein